jgi:hypothetical protein
MYKIKVVFRSNVIGVYTEHVETVTDDYYLDIKKERLTEEWMKILCPHVDPKALIYHYERDRIYKNEQHRLDSIHDLCMSAIKSHLQLMDSWNKDNIESGKEQHRQFDVTIEEIN